MKTASTDLFDLVKSLTPTEKGYFRKFALVMSGDKKADYLKLFDAIDKQTQHDEAALKKKFKNDAIGKNFAYNKLYLIDLILKVLKNFHRERTVQIEILNMLENNIVLQQRGLFSLAGKEVVKLEKFLDKYPVYWAKVICLLMKGDLMRGENKLENLKRSYGSVMEIFTVIDELGVQMLYFSLQYRLYILHYEAPAMGQKALEKELDDIGKAFDNIRLPAGKPTSTHIVYYLTKSFYYDLLNDKEASAGTSEELINCFMKNEHLIRMLFTTFISSIDFNIRNLALIGNRKKAEQLLQYLKNIKTFSALQETTKWLRYYTSLCNICLKFELYEKFLREEKKAMQMMHALDDYYNRYPNYDFFYHAACINLMTKRYDAVADHLNYLINDVHFKHNRNLQREVYTLCVILYLEWGQPKLLKHYIDTTLRFLAKYQFKETIEYAIVAFLKTSDTTTTPKEMKQLLKKLENQLLTGFTQYTSPEGYFDYLKWVRRGIAGAGAK